MILKELQMPTMRPKVGRKVQCHACPETTVKGTTQVYRKLIFHFCSFCWLFRREACHQLMKGA
jgi:hypothetical protein